MSQTVARLKELLFDNEAQALLELTRRLENSQALDARARDDLRTELKAELAALAERAGDNERFTQSVADVIDEALRRAEVTKHSELSISIAPLVVSTIKTELRNSQDEMVEALYPITGRLVKSYVASAIKDLTEDMNRRLERNPLMLRLQSLATGRSVGELALASTQDFEVLELFLIRRGSGELVAHWPQAANGREHLMSGVLAAVNAFANEALAADEAALRQIDLGDEAVYLRGSSLYLLAAKCSGTAPKGIEQTLDEAFLTTIEHELDAGDAEGGDAASGRLLSNLGSRLAARVGEEKASLRSGRRNPLKTLGLLLLLPLLAWGAWSFWVNFADTRTRQTASAVLDDTPAMQGYPAELTASGGGRRLHIVGLAPSQSVKDKLLSRLTLVLPRTEIADEIAVVPGSDIAIPDDAPKFDAVRRDLRSVETRLTISALSRARERAERRLNAAMSDLKAAALASKSQTDKAADLTNVAAAIAIVSKEIASLASSLPADDAGGDVTIDRERMINTFDALGSRINAHNAELAKLIGTVPSAAASRPSADPLAAGEALAADAERLSALASVIFASARIKPVEVPVPVAAPPPPPPDARDVLETWTTRNAIFFGNGADYREPQSAAAALDELAALVREADVLIRAVGYTDVAGNVPLNVTLAQDRADRVRADLIARGVPARLVVAIGRRDTIDLSPVQGPASPNRRVAFEVGFNGEAAPEAGR